MACLLGKVAMQRRAILSAAVCGFGQLLWPNRAQASLFRGVTLAALTQASEFILVATPLSASRIGSRSVAGVAS
jgi:hypothetical protein